MTFLVDGTNGGTFPSWTTATRPASPAVGQMGYNTTTGLFDAYNGSAWVSVATSATSPVSGPAFSAYLANTQTVTASTTTKVNFDTELFDTNNNFASSRFTPTMAGYYQVNAAIQFLGTTNSSISIYKTGSNYQQGVYTGINGGNPVLTISSLVYCNGSTDYIEIYGNNASGTSFNGNILITWFNGFLARPA